MKEQDVERIIEAWKQHLLVEQLEDYALEIDNSLTPKIAAIALFMDSKTVRAAGETEDFYEGYKRAAFDLLNMIGIEITQDDYMKVISVVRKQSDEQKQEELKKHIWG